MSKIALFVGLFVSIFLAIAGALGCFHISAYGIAGVMTLLSFVGMLYYLFEHSMSCPTPTNTSGPVLCAGDWILALGASLFSLSIFGHFPVWLTYVTGAAIVGFTIAYAVYYHKHHDLLDEWDGVLVALACQLLGPLCVWPASVLGWWNTLVIVILVVVWAIVSNKISPDEPWPGLDIEM